MGTFKVEVTFNVADGKETEFRNDIASALGWTNEVNGQGGYDQITRANYVERIVKNFLKESLVNWKADKHAEAERVAKRAQANAEIS